MARQLNIDELRTKTAAEIVVIARETFGVEIQGNKAQLLSKLKGLIDEQADTTAKDDVLTRDVVLENIRQGLVSSSAPATRLVYNKATGMVFRNHEGLASNPNLAPYTGKPVLVIHKGKQAVMHPVYARELFPDDGVEIVQLDDNLNRVAPSAKPEPKQEAGASEAG